MAPRKVGVGNHRIDAAIDRFQVMGYAVADVRRAVAALLKVYGGPAAWPFLEEGSYGIVQAKLLEMEEERKKQPLMESDHSDHHVSTATATSSSAGTSDELGRETRKSRRARRRNIKLAGPEWA
ncbi:hypothetical protein EJB05_44979 [Eragrostis curvula]|uniref:WIYLD domain-containing protein n=1 Tax=Eragrostis curvula TaxID=38414 RepID=A0A5J9TJ99_9POAL|nr:hypothetical protein EJB05_44979 [Eragrostis curvula]